MKPARLASTLHKWVGLLLCVQALLWVASGLYMVAVDLDFIHGDHLVRNLATPPARNVPWMPLDDVRSRHPGIERVRIKGLPGFEVPLYEIVANGRTLLLDGATGETLSPLPESTVAGLARDYYAGSGALERLALLEGRLPGEIRGRKPPLWRADFDDFLATSLYIDPATGECVTRRHRFWRWFDALWMLHIMDYESRENVNNALLRIASGFGLVLALSGLWLVYLRFTTRADR